MLMNPRHKALLPLSARVLSLRAFRIALVIAIMAALFPAGSRRAAAQALYPPENSPGHRNIHGVSAPADSDAATPAHTPLSARAKFNRYVKSLYDPLSILASLSGAGISQARDTIPEWGQGYAGYGRRSASGYGKHVVRQSIEFGIGGLLHYDPRYFASQRGGIWPRTLHAVSQTFRCKDDSGRWQPSYPNLAGALGAGLVSRSWHPERHRRIEDILRSGAISLALDAAGNVIREFWRKRS